MYIHYRYFLKRKEWKSRELESERIHEGRIHSSCMMTLSPSFSVCLSLLHLRFSPLFAKALRDLDELSGKMEVGGWALLVVLFFLWCHPAGMFIYLDECTCFHIIFIYLYTHSNTSHFSSSDRWLVYMLYYVCVFAIMTALQKILSFQERRKRRMRKQNSNRLSLLRNSGRV